MRPPLPAAPGAAAAEAAATEASEPAAAAAEAGEASPAAAEPARPEDRRAPTPASAAESLSVVAAGPVQHQDEDHQNQEDHPAGHATLRLRRRPLLPREPTLDAARERL